jgi:hypothetical protein
LILELTFLPSSRLLIDINYPVPLVLLSLSGIAIGNDVSRLGELPSEPN